MAKRQPIQVGGLEFRTKSALQEHIRAIVAKYPDEAALVGHDLTFVLSLLERHPHADVKIGCGVRAIIVRRNPVYRQTRGFYILRVDGSDTDFSWVECLNPTPHHKKVIRAMRALIEPQTMAFKQRFFDTQEPVCPLTSERLTFVGSHVDHVPPLTFERLVDDFCAAYGIDINRVPLRDELADNKYVDVIDDDLIAARWVNYHAAHAVLRVVSRLGNLSHSKMEGKTQC